MSDTPARPPLVDLQGRNGIDLGNSDTAKLIERLLAANNAALASQNSQPTVPDKSDKQQQQGNTARSVWSQEEERCLAELKLKDADRERDERNGHKKVGKMVTNTVSSYLLL